MEIFNILGMFFSEHPLIVVILVAAVLIWLDPGKGKRKL